MELSQNLSHLQIHSIPSQGPLGTTILADMQEARLVDGAIPVASLIRCAEGASHSAFNTIPLRLHNCPGCLL